MTMPEYKYSIEQIYRVYNDTTGAYTELGPNADGLEGLFDLVYKDVDGRKVATITFTTQELLLVSQVMMQVARDNTKPEDKR